MSFKYYIRSIEGKKEERKDDPPHGKGWMVGYLRDDGVYRRGVVTTILKDYRNRDTVYATFENSEEEALATYKSGWRGWSMPLSRLEFLYYVGER